MKTKYLRLIVPSLILAVMPFVSLAQNQFPPGQISYQGFLTDANGAPLATNTPRNFNVIFRIWSASTGGSNVWAEQQVVTVDRGYFTAMLGVGSSVGAPWTNNLSGLFNASDASDRYLEMTVQGLAVGDPPIAPRLRLLASPYSFLAANAVNAANVTGANTIQSTNLASNIGLWAANGANVYKTGGNVGIGTNSPQTLLHVFTSGVNPELLESSSSVGTWLGLQNDSAGGRRWNLIASGAGNTEGAGKLLVHDGTAGAVRMTLDTAGNVGINSTTPAAFLDVRRLDNSTGDAIAFGTQTYDMGRLGEDAGFNRVYLANTYVAGSGGQIGFRTGVGATPTDRLTIIGNGSVGIGTTSPFSLLHVNGELDVRSTSSSDGYVSINPGSGGSAGYVNWFKPGAARVAYMGYSDGGVNNLGLNLQNGAHFNINGGNLGIGLATSGPGARLHIKQSFDGFPGDSLLLEKAADANQWYIGMDSTSALIFRAHSPSGYASGYAYLTTTSFGLISTSDRRAKKDIAPLGDCLDRVMELRPSSFRYKSAPENTPLNYGFIAQEIETVFPDLVMEKDGMKTLATDCLMAVNTKAIQDLKREKDAEINRLKGENQALAERLAAVESALGLHAQK